MAAFPPRAHVILAREADTGVIIRRGPSKRVCVVGWDRRSDRFQEGQWFNGRIYERRSDLSPDGRHLIYFAMNGRWASDSKGSWSAISEAPYLKALTFLPKGDCWHGGGLFVSNKRYWLNGSQGHHVAHDFSGMERIAEHPWHESYGGECLGVYYIRLQRDGWSMREPLSKVRLDWTDVFEKRINDHWTLRKFAHATLARAQGRGCYYDEHELWNPRTGAIIATPGWEWADVDGDRLAWVAHGGLFVGKVDASGLSASRMIYDLSTLTYRRIEAPY